jgi:subtilase family serine protease
MKIFSRHQLMLFVSPLLLCMLSTPTQAAQSLLPQGWKARPPIHISSYSTHGPSGMSPAKIIKAYGFPITNQGAGQVIAIVDALDDPNIEADLAVFSSTFNLPSCTTANGCFEKVYASGSKPRADVGWAEEIALDVEWAHAIAPLAKIMLVEAADEDDSLYDAVTFAIKQKATVISLSWGGDEFPEETQLDSVFQASPVPIVASSGDSGAGVSYPAASPYVVSAGGTQLSLDANGNYVSEKAWNGSGGGVSAYESEPNWQAIFPVPSQTGQHRAVPDVAYNAAPSTGYSVYDSYGKKGGWFIVGGTSASAPQWAALIAIMKSTKNGNFANFNASIYSVARNLSLLHDTTEGSNGSCGYLCNARSGYDFVTGLGSPQAGNLIARFK